ncbi:MAG: hypothetical protein KAG18_03495, partial [Sinobacterium sp.]|nr:hypothetical protein [Sinobacterium sp.]
MRKHLIQANTFIMLMLCASHVFSANFLGLAEYEEIGSPVYLGSLTLDKKPNNPAHIHSMKGKKAMRFHIQKAGYPLRSFIRHLDSWATKGSAKNLKAKKTTKDSITQLQHSIKDALNRHFVKRGDIFQIDI